MLCPVPENDGPTDAADHKESDRVINTNVSALVVRRGGWMRA